METKTKGMMLSDELRARGPKCSRQGTEQETYAGPWIVSHEGSAVVKRELRFVEDDAPAGWQLLDGDYSGIAAALEEKDAGFRKILAMYEGTGSYFNVEDIEKIARAALRSGQEGGA